MDDLRSLLDRGVRGFAPSPEAFDRTRDRIARRHRNRRIRAAVVALGVAAAVMVPLALSVLSGRRTAVAISPSNVARLHQEWSSDRGVAYGPTISGDSVYVVGSGLAAYPLSCPANCQPTWIADQGKPVAKPVVAGGVVYASEIGRNGTGPGRLLAYSTECASSGRSCHPLWWANTGGVAYITVSPVVDRDTVFTATSQGLFAFSTGCATGGGECKPTWLVKASAFGAVPNGILAVDGSLWISTAGDGVYIVGESCGSHCSPVKHLLPGTGLSAISSSDGVVYVDWGPVVGFAASCATGPRCDPVFDRRNMTGLGEPAAWEGTVFIRRDPGVIDAIPERCPSAGLNCKARWFADISSPLSDQQLAFAPGLVFVGTGEGSVYAFPVTCENPCSPVWHATAGTGGAGVAVSGPYLIVTTSEGVRAYTVVPTANQDS